MEKDHKEILSTPDAEPKKSLGRRMADAAFNARQGLKNLTHPESEIYPSTYTRAEIKEIEKKLGPGNGVAIISLSRTIGYKVIIEKETLSS